MGLFLESPIKEIGRVGASAARELAKLGISSAADLLFYYPFRYDDYSQTLPISDIQAGSSVNIVGTIEIIQNKRSPRQRMNITEAIVSDETDSIRAVWFNQPFIAKNLKPGNKVSLAGKVDEDYGGLLLKSPSYEKIFSSIAVHTQGLIPNYHITSNLTQKQFRFFVKQIISLADEVSEWLPEKILKKYNLIDLSEAIVKIHFPTKSEDLELARRRLAFDELFLVQTRGILIKKELEKLKSAKINFSEEEARAFVDSLPFKLTGAQKKAAWEIIQDMEKGHPMSRLLSGDTGSGKTVVAFMAANSAMKSGYQAAMMAPTEILARQHFEGATEVFKDSDIKIIFLTGGEAKIFISGKEAEKISKAKAAKYIASGEANLIIGTHALIQQKILFKKLALAVVDEQHRFGVEQRKTILEKSSDGLSPHFLSMTATPIPRSLAIALFGDLDLSVINEMPIGRKKVETRIVAEDDRHHIYEFIREKIKEGRQAFVVCPLIDPSDKLGVKSAEEEYKKLKNNIFPDLEIGLINGRMKPKEKESVMKDFLANKINILVATSVVEVGVDVPNATVMMIEGAERFGFAQLHQFRGRVGRSDLQSYCFIFTDSGEEKTLKRLDALTKIHDGFELAKLDLQFRGPGEVYGTMQKGFPELKIANLFDYNMVKIAKEAAEEAVSADLANFSAIKEKLGDWEKGAFRE